MATGQYTLSGLPPGQMAITLTPAVTQPSTVLPVPYLSQWGTGADERRGDCGPACVAMLAAFLTTHRPTVDQAAAACGQPLSGSGSHYTGHKQLRDGAAVYGFALETRSPYTERYGKPKLTTDLLRAQTDAGKPSIALVHYGELRIRTDDTGHIENQDRKFGRGHWFLVVGYDEGGFYVNDPDYWHDKASLGDHRYIPSGAFDAALEAVAPGCTAGWQGLIAK